MRSHSGKASVLGAAKAASFVFCLSLVLGVGATHALVSAGHPTARSSLNGPAISFNDTRRLPTVDANGDPIQPLYSASMPAAKMPSNVLASSR